METDRGKALTQAWMDWSCDYRSAAAGISDNEVLQLAARRDIISNRTLARIRREEAERLERECRSTALEALYERQYEPGVYAAHQWGDWRPYDRFPGYERRDCADEACRRVQTRHAQTIP